MSPLRDFVIANGGEERSRQVDLNDDEVIIENENSSVFDEIVGAIEDIVVDEKFQDLQTEILEKYFHHFDVIIHLRRFRMYSFISCRIPRKTNLFILKYLRFTQQKLRHS